jgi:hypothetical protein
MFRNTTTTEPAPDVMEQPAEQPVPLSVLQLDLPAPSIDGWDTYLAGKGIEIMLDDLGRPAISRDDARMLLTEKREDEIRRREWAARQEQQAVERDRAFRAALPKGTHWTDVPDGVSAAQLWVQAEKDAKPKRRTPLEAALAGEGMVYRPLQGEEAS